MFQRSRGIPLRDTEPNDGCTNRVSALVLPCYPPVLALSLSSTSGMLLSPPANGERARRPRDPCSIDAHGALLPVPSRELERRERKMHRPRETVTAVPRCVAPPRGCLHDPVQKSPRGACICSMDMVVRIRPFIPFLALLDGRARIVNCNSSARHPPEDQRPCPRRLDAQATVHTRFSFSATSGISSDGRRPHPATARIKLHPG